MSRRGAPETPDGRYFVSRGKLWRMTNPALSDGERRSAIKSMMQARLALRHASSGTEAEMARRDLNAAKMLLGETGPVWWNDGAADLTGQHPGGTIYAAWWEGLSEEVKRRATEDAPRQG